MKKPKATTFVLDCSVALSWYFKDESDAYADAVAARFPAVQAIVPPLWYLEIANGVLIGERRKRGTEAETIVWLAELTALPIAVDGETVARAWGEVLTLARAQKLSVYDAAYLELAMRRGIPLATLDDKLRTAADAVGVAAFEP